MNFREGEPEEPMVGSTATDDSGHQWERRLSGWWHCVGCLEVGAHYPLAVPWSWREVLDDASGNLAIRAPV